MSTTLKTRNRVPTFPHMNCRSDGRIGVVDCVPWTLWRCLSSSRCGSTIRSVRDTVELTSDPRTSQMSL